MFSIVVTGCAGFIGSNLCEELLLRGHRIIGIDNFDPFYDKKIKIENLSSFVDQPNFSFLEADIREKNVLETKIRASVDLVIHLAAKAGVRPSIENPEEYISNNIVGTYHLMEWMKSASVKKMIFASSSSVYGEKSAMPFTETDDTSKPISPYAFTKKSCEMGNHTFHHLYNFDILNLRFFTVYGPRQRPDLAIHKFAKKLLKGEQIEMYGDGSSARDYTFISDIIDGIAKGIDYVMKNESVYEIVNLGNSSPVPLRELIDELSDVIGTHADIMVLPKQEGDVSFTCADIRKANTLLGYQPKVQLREGLEQFVKWLEK